MRGGLVKELGARAPRLLSPPRSDIATCRKKGAEPNTLKLHSCLDKTSSLYNVCYC